MLLNAFKVDGTQLSPELEEKLRELDGNEAKAASFQAPFSLVDEFIESRINH